MTYVSSPAGLEVKLGPFTLRRKTGPFKNFVIHPPDGEQFIAEARQLFGLPSGPL